jgi:hypothetical protein
MVRMLEVPPTKQPEFTTAEPFVKAGPDKLANYNYGRDLYNRIFVGAGDLYSTTGSYVIKTNGLPSWDLANAATQECSRVMEVPTYWLSGKLSIKLHYSTDTFAGNTVDIHIKIYSYSDGDDANVGTQIYSASRSLAESSAADVVVINEVITTNEIDSSKRTIGIFIERDGTTDTSAGVASIYGLTLQYLQSNEQ